MKKNGLRRAFSMGGIPSAATRLAQMKSEDSLLRSFNITDDFRATQQGALQEQADDIGTRTGLSARQKAGAIGQLAEQAGTFGTKIDTGMIPTGLSARQQLRTDMTLADADRRSDGFDLLRRQKISDTFGYQQGKSNDPAQDSLAKAAALRAEMEAKYGGNVAAAGKPQETPKPAAPQPSDADIVKQELGDRPRYIRRAFTHGGTPEHEPFVDERGVIHGPEGTKKNPDKVKAKVKETGEPILVGDDERIVNTEQAKVLDKHFASLGTTTDEFLEKATGKPVGPTLRDGVAAAQYGASPSREHVGKVTLRGEPVQPGQPVLPPTPEELELAQANGDTPAPWWQGKATAASTDMTLAGTPQHTQAVREELAAAGKVDLRAQRPTPAAEKPAPAPAPATPDPKAAEALAAVEASKVKAGNTPGQNRRPQGVTVADLRDSDAYGAIADQRLGMGPRFAMPGEDTHARRFDRMGQRFEGYANDPTALAARNAQLQLRGDGARMRRLPNGQIEINNEGDFDGTTKMPYTDKNGNPTAVHTGSMEHQRGLRDAAENKRQLGVMQQMNLERNAAGDITDRGLREYSRSVLDHQAARDAAIAAKGPNWLDIEKHKHELQKTENLQANNVRDFKAGRSDKVITLTDKLLDTHAPTAGLKDKELAAAQSRRADLEQAFYAAHKSMPEDTAEYAAFAPQMMQQAKLSLAMRDAIKGSSTWNKIKNLGHSPWQSLNALAPEKVGDMLVFDNGFSVPFRDVIGDDADLAAAYTARVQAK